MNEEKENSFSEDLVKSIIQEINFLRKDPVTYASKLRKYLKFFKREVLMFPGMPPILTIEGSKAFEEAAEVLDSLDPLPIMKQNPYLTEVSKDVLENILSISELENLNSVNVDGAVERHGKVVGPFSQALDFGSCNPELVVMNLLVDDGDPSRCNRNTLLSSKYKIIGVASSSHPNFLYCTVISFARHFFELGKEIGELSDGNYFETGIEPRNFDNRSEKVSEFESKVKNMCVDVEDRDFDEEIDVEQDVIKVEKNEKIIEEHGVKKRVKKIKKFKEDGVIETEIFKEVIN